MSNFYKVIRGKVSYNNRYFTFGEHIYATPEEISALLSDNFVEEVQESEVPAPFLEEISSGSYNNNSPKTLLGILFSIFSLLRNEIPISVNGRIPVDLAAESGYLTSRNPTLTNTAVQVKASDGLVMGWNFINTNSVTVYVKFYNLATNVTVGISPVLLTQAVPGGSASNPGINFLEASLIPQEVFSTGISIACVTGLADSSTIAPITPIYAEVRYK
ncbi:MAG: hypothetical protein AN483_12890 [Aphanizomenon flos-aquae MDT14a]|jgi:hypothetical protein|uniref:Uncharacterized protein n=1 Tax=Aphanizomenon flos-aquae WA102 TaxID=1710896 RepID=A0A1B7X2J8_APHFL|nr:MAG: hypothetical protein AN483_12890 [Aphanizomenon flos-aquae MDT14a]OBQ43604.1 MAG: hypothetical protein AN484_11400 [Aphanizomenon flos-aquae WA102]